MDDLLFAVKRAHLAGNRRALALLSKLGVTPARFDVLRILYARRDYSMEQQWLRDRLGVARSTLSRMLRSLERLGWIARSASRFDARTRWCTITYEGRSLVWRVLCALVRPRVMADVVDRAIGGVATRELVGVICWRLDAVLTVGLDDARTGDLVDG